MIRSVFRAAAIAALLCPPAAGIAEAADAAHGAQVFKRCSACHSADTATNKVGPSLKGVFGRVAGTAPDYRYSPAMQDAGKAGLVWDATSLGEFLASPRKKVPGTRMSFAGVASEADIADLEAYLQANP